MLKIHEEIYSERSGRNLSYRTFIWLLIRTFFRTWKDFENTTHATVARDAVYSSDLLSMINIDGYIWVISVTHFRSFQWENELLKISVVCVLIIVACIFTKFWFRSSTFWFDLSFSEIFNFFRNYKNFQRDLGINFHVYFHKIWKFLKIGNLFDIELPDFERYIWFK